jgi:hypothetical protein
MSTSIQRECVEHLNRIIKETDAKIVLSSAWRYMILCGAMTCHGFEYMLRTHGICGAKIIGTTASDEAIPERADQIKAWLSAWKQVQKAERPRPDEVYLLNLADGKLPPVESYVVIDDDPMGIDGTSLKSRLVKTDGAVGLTAADADKAIKILNKKARR